MGRLLVVESCPVCNYHVEGELHSGGSTRSRLFITHRYVIASCPDCEHVVSTLVKTPEYDLPGVLEKAHRDLETLKARAEQGDEQAARLVVLHYMALGEGDEDDFELPDTGLCTVCGGSNLEFFLALGGDEGEHFDDGTAWIACPRCEEGKLWLHTEGYWDELDSPV